MADLRPAPVLTTGRLVLTPCAADDVPRIHALLVEPEVRRFLLDDEIVDEEWVAGVVETSRRSFAEGGWGLWCLESRADGSFAGIAGLRKTLGAAEPQLLYALDPAHWGRSLATEAAAAVARYAFDDLGWRELLASTDPPNRASIRVMERLGMRFLEASHAAGHPLVLYRLTAAER